jgi:hypothetical protein
MARILMARGRDAADVAIATTFGPNFLESFKVWTDELASTDEVPRDLEYPREIPETAA